MLRSARLIDWLSRHNAIAHVETIRAEGFSNRDIRALTDSGHARRVRRFWIHLPTADSGLVRAAAIGGRLTCVSAAAARGLWTPSHSGLHVAVPRSAGRFDTGGLQPHWSVGPAPTSRFDLVEPVPNMLLHVALCLPRESALTVWESAIRKGVTDAATLRRIAWRSTRAREMASAASVLSDSGLETFAVLRLRPLGVELAQQVPIDGHRVDILIGERLIIQLDGRQHAEWSERSRDIRADTRLALMGYTVLRFTHAQILFEWDAWRRRCAPPSHRACIAPPDATGRSGNRTVAP